MNEPKTVRVRIAVAVDEHGRWRAFGVAGAVDATMENEAAGYARRLHASVCVHWIEADVPLPLAPIVVEGNVTSAARITDSAARLGAHEGET